MPLEAQTSAGGGANPPAPKGVDGSLPELPINDYTPIFFILGIVIGAYFLFKSKSVVK